MLEYEEIYVEYVTETDMAVLVDDGGVEVWIPVSQIEEWEPGLHSRGDSIDLNVAVWFLEKEGLL